MREDTAGLPREARAEQPSGSGDGALHALQVVDASDVDAVMVALRSALAGGPALLPKDFRAVRGGSRQEIAAYAHVPASVSVVIETSGSTGTPKRVALSAQALTASGTAAAQRLGGDGQWLLALPLTYVAGISVLVRSLMSGSEPVVLPPGHFDAQSFTEHVMLMTHERRYTSLVPVQLARLVEYAEDEDEDEDEEADRAVDPSVAPSGAGSARTALARLNAILIGGQALDPALALRARALGWNVVATYGSSETAGGCVYDGVPLDGVVLRVGDTGTHEIWISAPTLAQGYLGDDPQTSDRFVTEEGIRWYRTGDAGAVTDGHLTITGRLDRVLISGGLKISLDAVEAAARSIPGCATLVAVSIPNSEWGHVPALVVPGIASSPERDALDDALYDVVVAELGRAAAPRVIHHVQSLPRLGNGKVDLLKIAQMLQEIDQ